MSSDSDGGTPARWTCVLRHIALQRQLVFATLMKRGIQGMTMTLGHLFGHDNVNSQGMRGLPRVVLVGGLVQWPTRTVGSRNVLLPCHTYKRCTDGVDDVPIHQAATQLQAGASTTAVRMFH